MSASPDPHVRPPGLSGVRWQTRVQTVGFRGVGPNKTGQVRWETEPELVVCGAKSMSHVADLASFL